MNKKISEIHAALSLILIFITFTVLAALSKIILIVIPAIIILGVLLLLAFIFYEIYSYIYFRSKKFKNIKESIKQNIDNSNQLNHHIQDLKCSYVNIKSYDYGDSILVDNSKYNFKRKEWNNELKNNQVHNCSSTVCKNANAQPFKYLCKYFNLKIDEETLSRFENILNDFAAAEQGKEILLKEREMILNDIKNNIPILIYKLSKRKLIKKLGFEAVDLSNLYFPMYTFQYISPGGNSSSKCEIKLDVENLDKFVNYLGELIKFKNSVQGQRALMTSKLREQIKERDDFTCQFCSISARKEINLLLEIDHIMPLSKGGITTEHNLQTLCWKCNRSKGSKVL